jgi:hypothetical protein
MAASKCLPFPDRFSISSWDKAAWKTHDPQPRGRDAIQKIGSGAD